jgi:hypothetical protein
MVDLRNFFLNVGFWLVAGIAFFVSSLYIDHWDRVVLRFFYFPLIGLLLSVALMYAFQTRRFRQSKHPVLAAIPLCLIAALVTAAILNPLTYLQLGLDPAEHKAVILIPGSLLFAMTYFLWSVLYFHRTGQYPVTPVSTDKSYRTHINVETQGVKQSLAVDQIECILASGDYVELVTADHTYLKKETISALERQLNPACFCRVHRSAIINTLHVATISRAPGATYKIALECGQEITSSRSNRAIIDQLQHTDGE